jgi:adenosylhomocysteine nucleosidase
MDTSAIGDPVGLISGINVIEIPADKKIADTVMAAADAIGFRCLSGIVASGDRFIAGKENKKKIADTFSALVCEMEGAAIGQVCYVNKIPFCVVRAVSDKADGTSGVDYMTFVASAAEKNARLVLEAIKNI